MSAKEPLTVVFEDLPPKESAGRERVPPPWEVALVGRPGEWARLSMTHGSVGPYRSKYRRWGVRIEFTVRTVDGEKYVYARYLGNGQAAHD